MHSGQPRVAAEQLASAIPAVPLLVTGRLWGKAWGRKAMPIVELTATMCSLLMLLVPGNENVILLS